MRPSPPAAWPPPAYRGARAVIFAGGEPEPPSFVRAVVTERDLLVAANGGARLARAAGITPHLLVGDADSLDAEEHAGLSPETVRWLHPAEKDWSDLELAVHAALAAQAREIVVLGAFGGRFDHLMVNVGLLHLALDRGVPMRLLSVASEAFLLVGERVLQRHEGWRVTLVALTPEVRGLTVEGVAWPLTDDVLSWGSSRGLSNLVTATPVRMSVREGRLLVVVSAPPEIIEVRRTYLELCEPSHFRPRLVEGRDDLRLTRLERCSAAYYRFLYREAGRPWHWVDRLHWSDTRLEAHLADPSVSVWVLHEGGVPAGWFELRFGGEEAEIAYLGLLPGFLGRGLGGHLLTLAVQHAGAGGGPPRRVWLHTCTLDAPAALPNYLRRGFTPFREETYTISREAIRGEA